MGKIFAFCGSKGSGKSTSATTFKEVIGTVKVEEIAIAGHLKESCATVFQVDYDKFIDPKLKEVELETFVVLDQKNVTDLLKAFFVAEIDYDKHVRPHVGKILRTPRSLLQYIGTEVLHPIDNLIHVKAAMQKKSPDAVTVITDLRFEAEFNFFKNNYIELFVPVYVKNAAAEVAASVDAHPSERQFEKFTSKCVLLNNEGTLSDLRDGISKLIKESGLE